MKKEESFDYHLKEENYILKDELRNNAKHFQLRVESLEKEKDKLIIIIQNLKQQMGGYGLINFIIDFLNFSSK